MHLANPSSPPCLPMQFMDAPQRYVDRAMRSNFQNLDCHLMQLILFFIKVASTLNMKFKASCGRGLTDENLRFLASKAFRHPNPMSYVNTDFSNLLISWSQFCKEPLPDRCFTFWDWFHAVMKLTKEDLRPLWTNEYVKYIQIFYIINTSFYHSIN